MKTVLIIISTLIASIVIDLEKRILIDNRIEILVPKDFKEMSKELINIKYPGKIGLKLFLQTTPEQRILHSAFLRIRLTQR